MAAFRIHLRDLDARMALAWRQAMAGLADVEISVGDIFGAEANAIVSPANSFGFMDGGIDRVYSDRFGPGLERRLQDKLRDEYGGELLVGQAVLVPTEDPQIPWLVSAPTMRVPTVVRESVNAFLAFRAALRAVEAHLRDHPGTIRTVLCPGLCTAIGRMSHERAALQMRRAYDAFVAGPPRDRPNAGRTLEAHWSMLRVG